MGQHPRDAGRVVNLVDWLMIGAIIVFALVGWRQGFLAGALSFLGFLGGGLLAVLWLPALVERFIDAQTLRIVALAVGILISALIGQALLSLLGRRLRDSITWRPVRFVEFQSCPKWVGGFQENNVMVGRVAVVLGVN